MPKGIGYGTKGAKKMDKMSKSGMKSGKKKAKQPMRNWNRS